MKNNFDNKNLDNKLFDMNEPIFVMNFNQRSALSSSLKIYYYVAGLFGVGIGIVGLIKSVEKSNPLFLTLLIAGMVNIVFVIIGKSIIKEKNFISIYPEFIEYKNSFQKSKSVQLNNLLDVRIESKKIEFVTKDQQVKTYDFSIIPENELKKFYGEIEKVKSSLNE